MRKIIYIDMALLFVWLICLFRLYQMLSVPPLIAHIYLDPASTPALFQMTDLVQQPAEAPKYVAWRRYTHELPQHLLTQLNIQRSTISGSVSNATFRETVKQEIKDFYRQYPHYQFVIHGNMFHLWSFVPALAVIPKNQVKSLHLYEDSIGRILWNGCSTLRIDYAQNWPTVFRVAFWDEVKKSCPEQSDLTFQETNLFQLKDTLSSVEKKNVYALAGFDEKTIRPLFENGAVAVYLDDQAINMDKLLAWLTQEIKAKPELEQATWLYKNHPRLGWHGHAWEPLKNNLKKIEALPFKVPFEILILADLIPQYVLGYGSSSFFSVPTGHVLGYIKRPYDPYVPVLKKLGILQDNHVLTF